MKTDTQKKDLKENAQKRREHRRVNPRLYFDSSKEDILPACLHKALQPEAPDSLILEVLRYLAKKRQEDQLAESIKNPKPPWDGVVDYAEVARQFRIDAKKLLEPTKIGKVP